MRSDIIVARSSMAPARPYTGVVGRRNFVCISRNMKRCVTVKFSTKSGVDPLLED